MTSDTIPADRPQLKRALARVWRGPDTLQLGTGASAWVIRDLSPALKCVLDLCDGTRTSRDVVAASAGAGVDPGRATHFLTSLARAGVLEDAGAGDPGLRDLTAAERERLEPERASLSLASAQASSTVLAARSHAWVELHGDSRVVPLVAALFAAAGIGHVTATSPTEMTSYDALPGGASAPASDRRVRDVVAAAVASASTDDAARQPAAPRSPDLRILAGRSAVIDPADARAAMADGVPVLAVHARDLTGVVGPLVVSGLTACLHCLDLHRADRDPQWLLVAAQLANRRLVQPQPVSLLTIVAGYTVAQGLAFLDGQEPVATRNGTLEFSPPDWPLRRRGWSPHPDCGCIWPLAGEAG